METVWKVVKSVLIVLGLFTLVCWAFGWNATPWLPREKEVIKEVKVPVEIPVEKIVEKTVEVPAECPVVRNARIQLLEKLRKFPTL